MRPLAAGVTLHEWARANEAERQFSLDALVTRQIVESLSDGDRLAWRRQLARRRPDGSPECGLEWLNARTDRVAFGARRYEADRAFAVVQSQMWRNRPTPEQDSLADLADAFPGRLAVLAVRYNDHQRVYGWVMRSGGRDEPTLPRPRFEFCLAGALADNRAQTGWICRLDDLLGALRLQWGNYLRLERTWHDANQEAGNVNPEADGAVGAD